MKTKTSFGVPVEDLDPSATPAPVNRVAPSGRDSGHLTAPAKQPEDPPFPCVGCGACCAAVSHVTELVELGWVLPNGVCRHLDTKTKACQIYDERPTVCRINAVRPPLVKVETWHQLNWNVCGYLHKELYGEPIEINHHPDFTNNIKPQCKHKFPIPKNAIVAPDDVDDAATERGKK